MRDDLLSIRPEGLHAAERWIGEQTSFWSELPADHQRGWAAVAEQLDHELRTLA